MIWEQRTLVEDSCAVPSGFCCSSLSRTSTACSFLAMLRTKDYRHRHRNPKNAMLGSCSPAERVTRQERGSLTRTCFPTRSAKSIFTVAFEATKVLSCSSFSLSRRACPLLLCRTLFLSVGDYVAIITRVVFTCYNTLNQACVRA